MIRVLEMILIAGLMLSVLGPEHRVDERLDGEPRPPGMQTASDLPVPANGLAWND